MDPVTHAITVYRLGRRPYEPVWREMQALTQNRGPHSPDQIWLVEHPPVFTLGQAGSMEHVLAPGDIPVIHCDRGGQVTYHGPGQAVIYPLLDLRRMNLGIKKLVDRLEQAVIDTLEQYDIQAARRQGAPGVYVDGRKIASLGLRVRRGCSFHGLAFNVAMDLEPFQRINPCGFQGLDVTQLSELASDVGAPDDWRTAGEQVCRAFAGLLDIPVTFSDDSPHPEVAEHG